MPEFLRRVLRFRRLKRERPDGGGIQKQTKKERFVPATLSFGELSTPPEIRWPEARKVWFVGMRVLSNLFRQCPLLRDSNRLRLDGRCCQPTIPPQILGARLLKMSSIFPVPPPLLRRLRFYHSARLSLPRFHRRQLNIPLDQ